MVPLASDVVSALAPLRAGLRDAAVLFDLDGTVASIRPRPDEVALSPPMRAAMTELSNRVGLLAFVSGRSLADLEAIVGLPGCAYAGNHGMEIRPPGGVAQVVESARGYLGVVAAFAGGVDARHLAAGGAWMENKGVTLSFHYRTAPDQAVARALIETEVVPRAEAAGLRVTHGRKVVEVRPPVMVHKGTAVRQLVLASGCRLALYVGDDVTDVDAWTAVREMAAEGAIEHGTAVAVVGYETSDAVRAMADVTLDGVEGALELVRWLASSVDHASVDVG